MYWLLEKSVFDRLQVQLEVGFSPSAEQVAEHEARMEDRRRFGDLVATQNGDTAVINIRGVLTPEPDLFMAVFFGNTAYSDIIGAINAAEADEDVANIVLDIDSPGGNLAGLFDTMDAIAATRKPTTARVGAMAASAAYGLAASAGTIEATIDGALFGSVGVVRTTVVNKNVVEITNTASPDKRPDVTTDEGQAIIRETLDALFELFAGRIANGRDTTLEDVSENYGRGRIFVAEDAAKRGMIDCVGATGCSINTSSDDFSTEDSEGKKMDLNELKTAHPEVYAAAVNEGVAKERDRVGAHLTLGTQSGAMETAVNAVKDGSELTATLQAEYMAASMKKNANDTRGDDNADTGAVDGADTNADADAAPDTDTDATPDKGDAVVNALANAMGLEIED